MTHTVDLVAHGRDAAGEIEVAPAASRPYGQPVSRNNTTFSPSTAVPSVVSAPSWKVRLAHGTSCQAAKPARTAARTSASGRSALPAALMRYVTGMTAAGHTMPLVVKPGRTVSRSAPVASPGAKRATPSTSCIGHTPWAQPKTRQVAPPSSARTVAGLRARW